MLRLSRCLQTGLTLSLALVLALAVPALAQNTTTGSINGTITDQTGAVVSSVTVSAIDVDRHVNFPTTSDARGFYSILRLPPGRYEILAEKAGFKTVKQAAFTLQLNQVAEVNIGLAAGSGATTIVEVVGTAPLLETNTTEISTVIDSHATENIPLPTRNYGELTMLSPGAVNPNPGSFTGPQATFQSGRPYVNGNREQTNNYMLDGMDNSNHDNDDVAYSPSVDAIQEFNLITENAPADFGNYLGGVVNATIKSGTNDFHGDAFWFLRNTIFNANEWSNNLAGQNTSGDEISPRSNVHWNVVGGTIGGPIIKDKLFFFADFQGAYFHTGASNQASVLDAAERAGNFGDFCTAGFSGGACLSTAAGNTQLYSPNALTLPGSRGIIPNNNLTAAGLTLDPVALAIVNSSFYPAPTTIGNNTHAFAYHTSSQDNGNQGDFKLDWHPSAKDSVYARLSIMDQENPSTPTYLLTPAGFQNFSYPLQNAVAGWTRTLTPSLVNALTIGVSHFPINQAYSLPGGNNLNQTFGIASPSNLMPSINGENSVATNTNTFLGGGFDMGNDAAQFSHFADSELEVNDGLTWTKGKHEVHFGGQWIHYRDIMFYPGNQGVAGEFDFGNVYTSNPTVNCPQSNPNCTGAGEADFMLGLPSGIALGGSACPTCPFNSSSSSSSANLVNNHSHNDLIAFYGQDNIRLTSRLTVNVGLRWEDVTPRSFYDNSAVNWSLYGGVAQLSGKTTGDQALYKNYLGIADFQPRIGFAWQAVKNTVIRGAFGISGFAETNGVNNLTSENSPYANQYVRNYANSAPNYPTTSFSQGFTPLSAGTCDQNGVINYTAACYSGHVMHVTDPNLRNEVSRQWNLSVQHQFGNSTTFNVGYVGQSSYHLANIVNLHQPVIGAGGTLTPSPFLNSTIYSLGPGQIRGNISNGVANYNALQATLVQRLAHGLQAQFNLTWSKCFSDAPGYFGNYGDAYGAAQAFGGWAFPQDTYNQRGDYGLCNFDTRVDLNGYLVYDLPFGRGRQFANNMNKVMDGFVGGWSVDTDFTFHTGMRWDLLSCSGLACAVSFAPRPDCISGVPQHLSFQPAPASVTAVSGPAFQFLNPASVGPGSATALGNCPVDSHEGPGLKTMDLGVHKYFAITERQKLEVRVEATNFTNTPILALQAGGGFWGGSLNTGNAAFGTVQNSEGARQLQLALKYHF